MDRGAETDSRPLDGSSIPYGPWTAAWAGMAAHQVSTATLIAYVRAVERRWPIPTARAATGIGATWSTLTIAFEFTLGHYVAKQSWTSLLADYNLRHGRL